MADIKAIAEELVNLTVKEVNELATVLKDEYEDLVDGAPSTIKEGVAKAEAENLKKLIEAEGAKVELK